MVATMVACRALSTVIIMFFLGGPFRAFGLNRNKMQEGSQGVNVSSQSQQVSASVNPFGTIASVESRGSSARAVHQEHDIVLRGARQQAVEQMISREHTKVQESTKVQKTNKVQKGILREGMEDPVVGRTFAAKLSARVGKSTEAILDGIYRSFKTVRAMCGSFEMSFLQKHNLHADFSAAEPVDTTSEIYDKVFEKYQSLPPSATLALPKEFSNAEFSVRERRIPELQCPQWRGPGPCGEYIFRQLWDSSGYVMHGGTIVSAGEAPAPIDSKLLDLIAGHGDLGSAIAGIAFVPESYPSTDVLVLGLGAAFKITYLHQRTPWHVEVAELDPQELSLAQNYFGFPDLPNQGKLGSQCTSDGRLCVALRDALAHMEALAADGRRFATVFVDIGFGDGHNAAFSAYNDSQQKRFFSVLGQLAPTSSFNPIDEGDVPKSVAALQTTYNSVKCAPPDKTAECFLIGYASGILGGESAGRHAAAVDAAMGWAPFSLNGYIQRLQPINLKTS